jgi:ABC-type branched-subunit amino acid transport system ATPase component
MTSYGMTPATPLLQLSSIGKQFGGLSALSDVSLHIQRGEIYGLIGPNGAGKTTLFNVLTGLYQPSAGKFQFNGTHYQAGKPHILARAGIARTFQNIRLFANLTSLENVMIGRHVRTRAGVFGALLRNWKHATKSMPSPNVHANCCALSGLKSPRKHSPSISLMANNAAWKLRARWRRIRCCWHLTNLPPV